MRDNNDSIGHIVSTDAQFWKALYSETRPLKSIRAGNVTVAGIIMPITNKHFSGRDRWYASDFVDNGVISDSSPIKKNLASTGEKMSSRVSNADGIVIIREAMQAPLTKESLEIVVT